jgi:hypothetical protein
MSIWVAIISSLALVLLAHETAAQNCDPPVVHNASTVDAIQSFFQKRGKTVLTFLGYSGAGYQDNAAMLAHVTAILDSLDPTKTIVNIGATIDGIGVVYELAKRKGFETSGIVSSQARENKATLAPCAGTVFFVEDATWGGLIAGTKTLSPTSTAIVRVSDRIVAIGGGDIARDEFDAAEKLRKDVKFFPADMNHEVALARAAKRGEKAPTDFRGALGAAKADSSKK